MLYLPTSKIIHVTPAGFAAPYTLGICYYIKNHFNVKDKVIVGGSAGSWIGVYLASDISNYDLIENFLPRFNKVFNNVPVMYKWNSVSNFLKNEMKYYIHNTDFVENKQVKVSLTRINKLRFTNEISDSYNNLNELFELCEMSSYIPCLSGAKVPVKDKNIYIDNTFSREKENIKSHKLLKIHPRLWDFKVNTYTYLGMRNVNYFDMMEKGCIAASDHKEELEEFFK